MNILLIGDIFGKGGRKVLRHVLPRVVDRESVDLTIANVENASRGLGVSRDAALELKDAGVQVMTSGNHVWAQKGHDQLLEREPRLLRPFNYPEPCPGRGFLVAPSPVGLRVAVLNLQGRVFMPPVDDPFRAARRGAAALRIPVNYGKIIRGDALDQNIWLEAGDVVVAE